MLRLLLNLEGIDINARNDKDQTPLIVACQYRNKKVVSLLLAHDDIDVNAAIKDKRKAIVYACLMGDPEIVQLILEHPKFELTDTDTGFIFQLESKRFNKVTVNQDNLKACLKKIYEYLEKSNNSNSENTVNSNNNNNNGNTVNSNNNNNNGKAVNSNNNNSGNIVNSSGNNISNAKLLSSEKLQQRINTVKSFFKPKNSKNYLLQETSPNQYAIQKNDESKALSGMIKCEHGQLFLYYRSSDNNNWHNIGDESLLSNIDIVNKAQKSQKITLTNG